MSKAPGMPAIKSATDSSWEQRVVNFFDNASEVYAESYAGETPESHYYHSRLKYVLAYLAKLDGGKILDVGCGPGMMVEPCVERGFNYTGLDISAKMIDECRRKYQRLTQADFHVGRIQSLPFPDGHFDALLCMGAFEYVPLEEEEAAMAEMIRVTKPGGLIIISYLNRTSPYWIWNRYVVPTGSRLKRLLKWPLVGRYEPRPPQAPILEFKEEERVSAMRSRNLKIMDTLYFGFNIFLKPLDRALPRPAAWISRKLDSHHKGSLRFLGLAFIVVAQKASAMD